MSPNETFLDLAAERAASAERQRQKKAIEYEAAAARLAAVDALRVDRGFVVGNGGAGYVAGAARR